MLPKNQLTTIAKPGQPESYDGEDPKGAVVMTSNVDRNDLHNRTSAWVSSTEGQEALSKASKISQQITEKLEKDRQIDPKILNEPNTL